jgi:CDP-diacylglycerol--glycerol-3-phosphate 3-phosphatidyltransferase
MSWPNRITVARILLIAPFVIAILYMNETPSQVSQRSVWPRYCALMIFLIMAFSDALDGWLARRNHTVTHLGKFLDPLADKLLITCACLLLATPATAVSGAILPKMVVVLILGKDLYTVLGFIIIYLVTSEVKIVPVTAGKITTALQLSMVLAILISPNITAHWDDYRYFVRFLWWTTSGMAILTMIVYTRNGTKYLNEFEQQQKKKGLF